MRYGRAGVILGLITLAACGGQSTARDFLFDLATVNAVVQAPVPSVAYRGADEVTERTGAAEAVIDDLFLFEVVPPYDLAQVDAVSMLTDGGLWFYRDPSFLPALSEVVDGAVSVVVLLEQRALITDTGISILGQAIALGPDGAVVDSDWREGAAAAQLAAVEAVVREEGLAWSEALAALVAAARQEALDQPVAPGLGSRLLEAARAAG